MANSREEGAGSREDVDDDPILSFEAVLLRGYVIERFNIEEPGRHVSPELLGGRSDEQDDPQVKQIVKQMVEITVKFFKNDELQRLLSQVQGDYAQEIFMRVAREISADGINWGRVVALFHLSYSIIHKALITNDLEKTRIIIKWFVRVLREQIFSWLKQQGVWVGVICGFSQWRTVAIVASVALVAAIVYYRKTR